MINGSPVTSRESLTVLLQQWSGGKSDALDELIPLVYDELRSLAERYLRDERRQHTLQPTALVHEAYLKLIDQRVTWQNRAHFFGVAAQAMRRLLVDHARRKGAEKRGGAVEMIQLNEELDLPADEKLDVVRLDEALDRLAEIDPQQSRVVELRFFAGLSVEETAGVMGVSDSTVKREWRVARAWLLRELESRQF